MEKQTEIRHGRHVVFNLHVHLVFVTKYRRNVFNKTILDDLQLIFSNVCSDFEAELVGFDGEDDHVHLLVTYPPKVSISRLVNSLKGVSSRLIRKKAILPFRKNCGVLPYGLHPISLVVAAAHLFLSSDSISNNRILPFRTASLSAPYISA